MTAAEKEEELALLKYNAGSANRVVWYWVSISFKTCRDFTEEAKSITAPVLYLYGERSDFAEMTRANIDFFNAHLPNAMIYGFADGIHDLQTQKPREVASLILEFLKNE
jgi:pimeloyl-ACP methyl ester carboxylesterase